MLHCIYHPLLGSQVVDDAEKDRLISTGVWFDHPKKAEHAKKYYEDKVKSSKEIKNGKRRKK